MITLTQAEIDALDGDLARIGVFFRMATDPIVRLWIGIGNCHVGINALDASGAIYSGLGELRDVPSFNQLINGVAERVTFQVSGVSTATMNMASSEAEDVKGAQVNIGISLFGKSWQQLGVPKWLFRGLADFVTVDLQPSENGIMRTMGLSVGSLFTGRRRRGFTYLTDRDQQARSPGDKFCERTVLYSNEVLKNWPSVWLP